MGSVPSCAIDSANFVNSVGAMAMTDQMRWLVSASIMK